MPKKRGVGRPRLPRGEKLGDAVRLRLRPEERKAVELAAEAAGETVSAWLRRIVLHAAQGAAR